MIAELNEVLLLYAAVLLLAWPLGLWLAAVHRPVPADRPGLAERLFGPVERLLYRAIGVDATAPMGWRDYAVALLKLHLLLGLLGFAILLGQGWLPLNPARVGGLSWDLALHTAVSFLTNTNQQHYSGQAQLSDFSQLFALVTLQFVTPAAGLAVLVAILRGLFAPANGRALTAGGATAVGNFYADLVRTLVRVLLPLALVLALLLAWQGVPNGYGGAASVTPLDDTAGLTTQRIPLGPVAPMVAIKQLGTNGGGWYGPNSAMPLENPTPLSNFLQLLAIPLLAVAVVVMAGALTGRRRLAWSIMAVMLTCSVALTALSLWAEQQPNPAFAGLAAPGPNLEGKEVRIGAPMTALWGSLTTQTSNGSVNGMLDSFQPLGGAAALIGLFINAVFGGVGVGLINYLLFLLLAAFLGSLMVGRAPAFYGRPLEAREMKLMSVALLLPPLLILGLTAVTVAVPGLAQHSNPGFHGLTQVLYEYSSAVANNGSGFEGLGDNTPWWNLSCVLALLLGRFVPMLAPLALAAGLAAKRVAPPGSGGLDLASPTVAALTLGVMLLFTLLGFLPVLVLGPVAAALGGA